MSMSLLPSAWRENEKGLNVSLLCATAKPLAVIRLPSFASMRFDSNSILSPFGLRLEILAYFKQKDLCVLAVICNVW